MPDKRTHRGRHPDDERLFAPGVRSVLCQAVEEYCWLRSRGYALPSSLKLVGDRYDLTVRQRMAVRRTACSDASLPGRKSREVALGEIAGQALAIDGYNLLITIESALSGGVVLVGRDGCTRDLASVHGTYRRVEETRPALALIVDHVAGLGPSRVDWYLDSPVSNSGRLKAFLAEVLEEKTCEGWNIELVENPDRVLIEHVGVVATSDSNILDRCGTWVNLAATIIAGCVPGAWVVDLGSGEK